MRLVGPITIGSFLCSTALGEDKTLYDRSELGANARA